MIGDVATGTAVLAIVGLVVGLALLLVVLTLFNRVIAPALQIDGYAKRILDAGLGIAHNVDGVDELRRTRELATTVPGLATAYLERLGARER